MKLHRPCSTCRHYIPKNQLCSHRDGLIVSPESSCFFHVSKDLEPSYEACESKHDFYKSVSSNLRDEVGPDWLNKISAQDLIDFIEWAKACGYYNLIGYDRKLFAAFRGFVIGRSKRKGSQEKAK